MKELGYSYNGKAQAIIKECDDWYSNNATAFNKRINLNGITYDLTSLNFAKRCCADDANLCEIIEINAGESESKFEGVQKLLDRNRFGQMYRKQLEHMAASGTVGCYIKLDNATLYEDGHVSGGDIRINYCDAGNIVPLTVTNDEVIECAFCGETMIKGQKEIVLVIFLQRNGAYEADSYYFDADGKRMSNKDMHIQFGNVKPFAIMMTAEVNNLSDMAGYGYPKLYNAIPVLKCLDLAYNVLFSDLDKGEKMVFINELLAVIQKDVNGMPTLTPAQKKLFILLGDQLGKSADEKTLVQEYNPKIRVEEITKIYELCLSLLSMTFGFGTKKYTFENGQIKTASEYIGEKQDSMQELNKQRYEAESYIRNICRALIWFSNQFKGTSWNIDEEISVQFDDSYITDKQTELEIMRADAISFPQVQEFLIQYVMLRMNCEREEALSYIQNTDEPIEDVED